MASVISTMKRRLTLQWALVWLEICKLNLQTTSYTTITGDGVKTRWSVWNPTYVEEFGAIWAFWHSKGKVHHFALLPWASSSVSFGIDGTPSAPQPLLWLCPPPPTSLVLQSSKSLALFRHIYFPLTRKPFNWWMRTLWEMAGVVMPLISLRIYLPLGWWREGWTTTFLDPGQAERRVWAGGCHVGRG